METFLEPKATVPLLIFNNTEHMARKYVLNRMTCDKIIFF
jgi:hypothetical protein